MDGNDDGKPGANFVATFGGGGLTFARPSAFAANARLSAAAVDGVLNSVDLGRKGR